MDKANMSHYKALIHGIKYKIDTKDCCCLMKPDENINVPQELCGYSDADYARDNDTQKIVTGYIVLINGAVIVWSLLGYKTITLSVTESECRLGLMNKMVCVLGVMNQLRCVMYAWT